MSQLTEVKVPDIGDFKDVPVIEVLVKPGDVIKAEDALITLESDKATMDVPSPAAGTVKEVAVKVGDEVAEGVLILLLETAEAAAAAPSAAPAARPAAEAAAPAPPPAAQAPAPTAAPAPATEAASPVPEAAPAAVDSTGEGVPEEPPAPGAHAAPPAADGGASSSEEPIHPLASAPPMSPAQIAAEMAGGHKAHASPSIRRFARKLGVDVARVKGSGPKGRVLKDDVQAYVKGELAQPRAASAGAGGLDLLAWPQVDFAKFGPVDAKPLSRINKISAANLHRNWVMIPHVTQFDEADITDLEAFRVQLNKEQQQDSGAKLTMLVFLIKACVAALKRYPQFNASLDNQGGEISLVMKRYFHIGFAADTPTGLVVPVIRDVDRKGAIELAQESAALAQKGRDGKLSPGEMQGGCFTISSLGGIGGTAFTPIINAPEVAILGVSKSQTKALWNGKEFAPRLTLPLSLSYDHRVIDGAAAARFTAYLGKMLADMRRIML